MGKLEKLLQQVLSGASDANIAFDELCGLLLRFGFDRRIRGSHHIFTRDGLPGILNRQDNQGRAKPYQVKQVRGVILKYRLAREFHE